MARRIGGLQGAVRNMVRQSNGANNNRVRAFLSGSAQVGAGTGRGGGGEQYPEEALTMGGEYITLGGEYLVMQ